MTDLDLSFGGVEPPKCLPDGTYWFVVAKAQVKNTQGSDTKKYINFQYNLDDDDFDGDPTNIQPVFDMASLEPNARWKLQQVLEAITQQLWRDDNMNLDLADLIGEKVQLTVITDTYNGQKRNKVKSYHGAPQTEDGD